MTSSTVDNTNCIISKIDNTVASKSGINFNNPDHETIISAISKLSNQLSTLADSICLITERLDRIENEAKLQKLETKETKSKVSDVLVCAECISNI
jgi:hypothetical protein